MNRKDILDDLETYIRREADNVEQDITEKDIGYIIMHSSIVADKALEIYHYDETNYSGIVMPSILEKAALLHDMCKLFETETKSHGQMAYEYLKELNLDPTTIYLTNDYALDAIKYHSNKDMSSDNEYFTILKEADILSKSNFTNLIEYLARKNVNSDIKEDLSRMNKIITFYEEYKPETKYFIDNKEYILNNFYMFKRLLLL